MRFSLPNRFSKDTQAQQNFTAIEQYINSAEGVQTMVTAGAKKAIADPSNGVVRDGGIVKVKADMLDDGAVDLGSAAVVGELAADRITAGTLTGFTVQTNDSGRRIVLHEGLMGGEIEFWSASYPTQAANIRLHDGANPMLIVTSPTGTECLKVEEDGVSVGVSDIYPANLIVYGNTYAVGVLSASNIASGVNSVGATLNTATSTAVSFGKTMLNIPAVTCSISGTYPERFHAPLVSNVTTDGFTVTVYRTGGTSGNVSLNWIAVGN